MLRTLLGDSREEGIGSVSWTRRNAGKHPGVAPKKQRQECMQQSKRFCLVKALVISGRSSNRANPVGMAIFRRQGKHSNKEIYQGSSCHLASKRFVQDAQYVAFWKFKTLAGKWSLRKSVLWQDKKARRRNHHCDQLRHGQLEFIGLAEKDGHSIARSSNARIRRV